MATLKDIANEAGVSIMTVSNVINRNYSKVSQKNIEKINEIIKKHRYVPNMSARSLTSKTSKIICALVPIKTKQTNFFKDPYISELLGVIETMVREYDYYFMLRSVANFDDISGLLNNWNIDGGIYLIPPEEDILEKLKSHPVSCPIVFLDGPIQSSTTLSVGIDDYKGGYIATKHMIHNGHTNIGFIGPGPLTNPIISVRYRGYVDALREANISLNEQYVFDIQPSYDMGLEVGRKITKNPNGVTAVVVTADILAAGIIEGLRLNGMIVPNDISVVGFDDLDICRLVSPKLTTISQDVSQKATKAVTLLMNYLQNNGDVDNHQITLDVELVDRQSVRKLDI